MGTEDTITASLKDYDRLMVTRNHQMNNAEVVMKTDPLSPSMVTVIVDF